ncbi:uncharacterized protein LOC127752322 [Frankliniella occidentalis]|uniref:Uncharacterized protein LOC127752322 n=1 Tax=Frankliniella occidentalis TaxID=133901 RepID=A0A9C6XC85_FRAOC|nr:uncharacterized protein LOC127752322 [Frankliniella occidentalis]
MDNTSYVKEDLAKNGFLLESNDVTVTLFHRLLKNKLLYVSSSYKRGQRISSFVQYHKHSVVKYGNLDVFVKVTSFENECVTVNHIMKCKPSGEDNDVIDISEIETIMYLIHINEESYIAKPLNDFEMELPAQLEAELVHPVLAVSALVPASVALPPGSSERPALLAVSFLLHVAFLLCLPSLAANLEGDATPRALLVYRDVGLLFLVVALQWLLSLRLASRTRPLSSWSQSVARGLSMLRTLLLLPVLAPVTAPVFNKPLDEQSVQLSKILDRLTFFAVSASYIALVTIGLQ